MALKFQNIFSSVFLCVLLSTSIKLVVSSDDDGEMPQVQYWHNYNLNGISSWANCTFSNFQATSFIPDLPPQYIDQTNSSNTTIVSQTIIWLPSTYFGDWHCNPQVQLNVVTSGKGLWTSQDGVAIEFGPGSYYLGDDLGTGGHTSETISDTPLIILTTQFSSNVSDVNNPCWL